MGDVAKFKFDAFSPCPLVIKGQTFRNNINNKKLEADLRQIEPGKWDKIFKNGWDANGKEISIHYFQSPSGKVFDVKVKDNWSIKN